MIGQNSKPIIKQQNSYGRSKWSAENYLFESKPKSLRFFSLRLPGVIGFGGPQIFIPRMIGDVKNGLTPSIFSKTSLFNSILTVPTFCAHVNFLIQRSSAADVPAFLNLGGAVPMTLLQIVETVFDAFDIPCLYTINPSGRSPYVLDIRPLEQMGFNIRTVEEEILCSLQLLLNQRK